MAKRKPKKPTKQVIARHHSDWMRLIERSGPFLSLPVLMDVFPLGLDADDRENRVQLKQAYESWLTNKHDIAVHRAWVKYVLTHSLELPEDHIVDAGHIPQNLSVRVDVHHETLTPDMAVIESEDKDENTPATPRMIVMIVPPDQALDKTLNKKPTGSNWPASPQTRMSDLIRGCNDQGITFGLLTNGEQWMLVYSKQGETASFTTWYASIWFDEKITLRAFRDLLSARRFYGDPDRTLDKLFERSADDQHEVTDQLGLQVRDAIETLVDAIDEIDRDRKRKLLAGFSEEQLYEACVTVMMRLVFLFFAEERRLLPVKEQFYEQNYSLHTLFEQLQNQKNMGEEQLEWAYSGWCRLLALFRAIHGGVQHDDMQLHAYGSSLFDPDRFPFLEGRPQDTKWRELESQPLPINDRTLLHVLEALKLLEVRGIGGGQRITRIMSFRELDVEDIGHIYESLLDHTAKRAKGHVLGLVGSKGKEPELSLAELEKQAELGREALVDYLKDETGKTPKSIEKLLDAETKIDESRLLAACGNDEAFAAKAKPFANLVRENRSGDPIIIPDGSVYVTEGTDRRSSGTHYTPRSLTEPIVQHTLEPLVYEGPAEGKPQDEWKLKTPAEILELNICDMACGSGAFLVQACRYMAERLVEAWQRIEQNTEALADDSQTAIVGSVEAVEMVVEKNGKYATSKSVRRPRITPLGEVSKNDPSEELIPLDPNERMIYARRIVADRCLYGVDVNPLACEMGKLSLWLLTLARDKPFTFLNHAIRCGDSLIGLRNIAQLRYFSLSPEQDDAVLFSGPIENSVDDAIGLRIQLEGMPTLSIADIDAKMRLLAQSEDKLARMRCAADLLVAAQYWNESSSDVDEAIRHAAVVSGHYVERGPTEEFEVKAIKARNGQRMFHWPLEFPEVFESGGFDAIVGNPPFMGGSKIATAFGVGYRDYLIESIAEGRRGQRGQADLCSYFLCRLARLTKPAGSFGVLATNTIAQGDSRIVGLDHFTRDNLSIYRAVSSRKWPGAASLEIAALWVHRGIWKSLSKLDGEVVSGITSFLTVLGAVTGMPEMLAENDPLSYEGSRIEGKGFVLTFDEASELEGRNSKNSDVIYPFLRGQDFNTRPDQSPAFKVINFHTWPLTNNEGDDYSGPVAEDYPDCLSIVREKVKPQRDALPQTIAINITTSRNWWRYRDVCPALHAAIKKSGYKRILFHPFTSKYIVFAFVEVGWVYSAPHNLFIYDDYGHFACLQSSLHEVWARTYCSTLRTDIRYTRSSIFDTFAFPKGVKALDKVGEKFYSERGELMRGNEQGLTQTYNRLHSNSEKGSNFSRVRETQVEMDNSVLELYGWDDLKLEHGFIETKHGVRFTISKLARREVLQRLLKLNHGRAENPMINEVGKPRKKRKSKAAAGLLFDDEG